MERKFDARKGEIKVQAYNEMIKKKLEEVLKCKIDCTDNFHINFKENDSRIAEANNRFDWIIDEIVVKDCCEIIRKKA